MLCDRLGVGERWACRVVGQHRSTQRHEPKRAADDAALRARLRRFSVERPRWGYRRAHHRLRQEGWEVTAHALQDWCRFSKAWTAYIEPGSPWQNPYIESFHSRVRDELLDVEEFTCLAEAKVVISDWREDYNLRRPHSALGMRAPAAFAAQWTTSSELPITA